MFFSRGHFSRPSFVFFSFFIALWAGQAHAAQMTVSWTDNSNNESDFRLERKTGATGTYVEIATLDANVISSIDTAVVGGTTYCYRVRAHNNLGFSSYSNETCSAADTQAPVVSITAPAAGATVAGTVTVTASASDNIGVAGVQFRLDGVDLASEDTTSPYSISWDTTAIPNGSHTLTASAHDKAGNQTLSAGVAVTVNNPSAPLPTAGLAVAYNFNEGAGTTVTDASGNNRNGTVAGATWATTGKYSKALSFDGGAAKVTSGLNTHATTRSYMLWTNRAGAGGGNFGRIFDKRVGGAEVELLYNDEGAGVYRYIRAWSGGIGNWTIPQPSLNAWHHIAVVYDASSSTNAPQIYVDGVAQAVAQVSAPSGTPLTNADPYMLGNRGAGDRGWSGMLDDLRIYDGALTAAQIKTAMITAVTPSTTNASPLAASVAYNFDEGTGVTVTDASGNNRNGTVAGATWTATGKYGKALSFSGSTAKVTSGLNAHAPVRSYLLWTNRTGAGGGSLGRIFDKRTSGGEVEVLYNDDAAKVYRYIRLWSGGVGSWSIPQPSLNVWHHIAVVYDASSAANKPQIYVDGVAQVVNQVSAPSGTALTNVDPYVLGNRGAGDRGWSGMLDDFRVYSGALTAAQVQVAVTTAVSTSTATLNATTKTLATSSTTTKQPQPDTTAVNPFTSASTIRTGGLKNILGVMLGTFRSTTGRWQFDRNGNGVFDGCTVDRCLSFGQAGDLPVVGDWLGTGKTQVGSFDPTTGSWQLDRNGNGVFDGCMVDLCLSFGQAGDLPVVGDWLGTGQAQVGSFDPTTGSWQLDLDGNGMFDGCTVDRCLSFGQAGDLPVVGDWLGVGKTQAGSFDPQTGLVELDRNGNGVFDGCKVDTCLGPFGQQGAVPVVSNW